MMMFYMTLMDDENERIQFEELYMKYRNQMMALAMSLLENKTQAEDVVHDVFLCVASRHMKFIQTLSNPEDVKNYLLKATKNTALNERKRKVHNNVSIETIAESELKKIPNYTDDNFLELLCTKVEYDKLVQVLLSMKEPYRDIMYYHFVLELSIPEVAKQRGQSIMTTKVQLVRGKKLLLKELGAKGESDDDKK